MTPAEAERLRQRERELGAELAAVRTRLREAGAAAEPAVAGAAHTTPAGWDELFAVVEKTRMPMVLTDPNQPDNPIVFANRAFQELSGYGAADLLGRNCRFLQGLGAEPAAVQRIRDALAARREVAVEITNYRRDGTPFANELFISPVFDRDGRLRYFFGSQLDVSANREDRRRLAASEERLRLVVESALDYAILTTDSQGVVSSWAAGAAATFGYAAGEIGGRPSALLFTPEDRAAGAPERELDTARRDGAIPAERWHLRRDGSRVFLRGTTRPLQGGAPGFLKIARDETERLRAEAALRELNATLESRVAERTAERDRVWRLSTDLMLVARSDGVIAAVNPAWTALLGWEEDELVGRSLSDLVHPDDLAQTRDGARSLAGGELRRFENRCRHKDGGHRWIAWAAVPGAGLVTAVGRDVSAEKAQAEALARAEEQLRQAQKMEAVGQLTGGIAHDFNNLLTGITGSLELLQARVAQGRVGELDRYVAAAQGAAKRAAALTHRLLAFSRRQTLDPKPTDLNRLVAGMEELIRRTVGPAVAVEVVAAAELWASLIDPGQLENALLNLCINARDAMAQPSPGGSGGEAAARPDGGRLTIATANRCLDEGAARERGLPPGQYVSLCVGDTGTGMTPDVAARAFDPFFTTKPIGQGTGLGLSMVYGFARQSGGRVFIASELGRGTAVSLYLPRHHGPAEDDGTDAARIAEKARPAARKTVLVVDDEPTVRMLVTEALEDLGHAVVEASDGAAALDVLRSGVPLDLLITDVGLPGGTNGRQVADAGRAARPGLRVLFITGYAETAAIGHGHLEPGMQVLTKPFAMDALASRIKDMIAAAF